MKICIPEDLENKSYKEIREMILTVGLIPFSSSLVTYLQDNLESLKENIPLLEKIAVAIDAVLFLYQINKISQKKQESLPIDKDLVNKFVNFYTSVNKGSYGNCR